MVRLEAKAAAAAAAATIITATTTRTTIHNRLSLVRNINHLLRSHLFTELLHSLPLPLLHCSIQLVVVFCCIVVVH